MSCSICCVVVLSLQKEKNEEKIKIDIVIYKFAVIFSLLALSVYFFILFLFRT